MHFRATMLLTLLLITLTACASPGIQSEITPSPLTTLVPSAATATISAPVTTPGAATPTFQDESVPYQLQRAQAHLAELLGVPGEQVVLKSSQPAEWPDACLGVNLPGQSCAQVITPGFRAIFSTPQGDFNIHTDQSGNNFQIVPPTDPGNQMTPAVVWERSGGIRGICQKLTIGYNGSYILEDCNGTTAPFSGVLSGQNMKALEDFANRFQTFDWKFTPPQGSADMFTDQFTFYGKGTAQPSEDEKTMINELLAGFASEIVAPTTSSTEATTQTGQSGIEGQALVGPACPGPVRADQPCPDKPYQGAFTVLNQAGEQVGQFQTGPDGRFHLALPPGIYTVHPDTSAVYPLAQDQTVTVQSGQFSEVNLTFDSGIR